MGQAAYDAAVLVAEAQRQAETKAATSQGDIDAATQRFRQTVLASAGANGITLPPATLAAFEAGPPIPQDTVVLTDGAPGPLAIIPGYYSVTLAATFGDGDTITLADSNSLLSLSWTANREQNLTVAHGTGTLALTVPGTSSAVTCTFKTIAKVGGSAEF